MNCRHFLLLPSDENSPQKKMLVQRVIKIQQDSQNFLLFSLTCSQIWLILPIVDDHQCHYDHKLEGKKTLTYMTLQAALVDTILLLGSIIFHQIRLKSLKGHNLNDIYSELRNKMCGNSITNFINPNRSRISGTQ